MPDGDRHHVAQAPRTGAPVRPGRPSGRYRQPSQPPRYVGGHDRCGGRADLGGTAVHRQGARRSFRRLGASGTEPVGHDAALSSASAREAVVGKTYGDLDFLPRVAEYALRPDSQGETTAWATRRHPASYGRRARSRSRTRVPTRTTPFRLYRAALRVTPRRAPWTFARSRRHPRSSG